MSSITGRKIIQVTTCPINSVEIEGSIHTTNAVFVLCDDGTLWMQIIGGGGEWTQIDGPPQGIIRRSNPKPEGPKNRKFSSKEFNIEE